jgi:hypothetical protein
MTLSTQPRQCGFKSQPDPGLEPEHLWRELKIAVQRRSPSNLTELERIYREEWEKLPKYMYAELVGSYPRRIKSVIAAKSRVGVLM